MHVGDTVRAPEDPMSESYIYEVGGQIYPGGLSPIPIKLDRNLPFITVFITGWKTGTFPLLTHK